MVIYSNHDYVSLVTQVDLVNFRNYAKCSTKLSQFNVLFGNNGSGKTNFLEALSLLSPGKGLKGANFEELISNNGNTHLQAYFTIKTPISTNIIGIVNDINNQITTTKYKKAFLLDNEPLKKFQLLVNFIKPVWLTPKMDTLFLEESKIQRNFFDRLIFNLDPHHLTRINSYNKALKERNLLLKTHNKNETWYNALEEILSTQGVAIAATRLEFLEKINYIIKNKSSSYFSNIHLSSDGFIENSLSQKNLSALMCETLTKEQLKKSRPNDLSSGVTTLGIHKSNVNITHLNKNLIIKNCSTGEQKLALLTIIIAFIKLLLLEQKSNIIILLDEALVHLDETIKNNLLEELLHLPVQVLITSTDINYFYNFKKYLNFFEVKNNIIKPYHESY